MEITTKELRIQPGKIIDQVSNGQEITVTFRGKALARIVPIKKTLDSSENETISIFGMWKRHSDEESIDNYIRNLRKGRKF
jgi:prevent-host-death family protein